MSRSIIMRRGAYPACADCFVLFPGNEMIAAGKVAGSEHVVYVHIKFKGGPVDLTVRSADQTLSNSVHAHLTAALR